MSDFVGRFAWRVRGVADLWVLMSVSDSVDRTATACES